MLEETRKLSSLTIIKCSFRRIWHDTNFFITWAAGVCSRYIVLYRRVSISNCFSQFYSMANWFLEVNRFLRPLKFHLFVAFNKSTNEVDSLRYHKKNVRSCLLDAKKILEIMSLNGYKYNLFFDRQSPTCVESLSSINIWNLYLKFITKPIKAFNLIW